MPEEKNKTTENKNDTLAFIIGGIFILGLVFATYNYFRDQSTESLEEGGENQERRLTLERLKETLSTNTEDEGEEEEEMTPNIETEEDGEAADVTTNTWTANNYDEGDISTGEYTVKSGDTLWEIAEAVYGDGTMWTKIRDANSANIDLLPNGQQALIYAGQTLTIPA